MQELATTYDLGADGPPDERFHVIDFSSRAIDSGAVLS